MVGNVLKHTRVVGVVVKNNEVLLIHRLKPEREYFVFPGGKQEEGETEEQALAREMKEELNFDIKENKHLFNIEYTDHLESYYLINEFTGELKLGGPEIDRLNDNNIYKFTWVRVGELCNIHNLVPKEALEKIISILTSKQSLRILVFLHGTIIVHKNGHGKSRSQIIQQVISQEPSVRDFASYEPIAHSVAKLNKWVEQEVEILYLSALTKNKKARGDELVGQEGLKADQNLIKKFGFPKGKIYHRQLNETYADVIRRINPLPNILIEDDCESIGGETKMTYSQLDLCTKTKIKLIKIQEFVGIDNLPDSVDDLLVYNL